jgi:predicted MPP superfamily phosphohydrolase
MANPFLLLHLSDAHIGNPKYSVDIVEVFRPLTADLREQRKKFNRAPDLIVFSGDLVFGELPTSRIAKQFEQARDWIRQVYSALETDSNRTRFLLVPGNHDLNRNVVGEDQTYWLRSKADPDAIYQNMHGQTELWRRFLARQNEWSEFAERELQSSQFKFEKNLNASVGVLEHHGFTLGFVGLNTSWAACDDEDHGKLWIGEFQRQTTSQRIADADFRAVVSHHPVSSLSPKELSSMEQKLQSNFHLHLHGHVHDQWYVPSVGHLRVQAGPCYAGSTKPNAYSWLEIDFETRRAQLKLRTYTIKGSGGWGPLFIPGRTNDSGEADVSQFIEGWTPNKSLATPQTQKRPKARDKRIKPDAEIKLHDETPLIRPKSIPQFRQALEERFGFRWEPGDFNPSADAETVVYWPVRLRRATPIHMVQSYAAFGLLRLGATICLYLDDLGNIDSNIPTFRKSVELWGKRTHVHELNLVVQAFSGIMTEERAQSAWELIRGWFTKEQYKLNDVLAISKLWPRNAKLEEFSVALERKPRPLLTPPLVWTGLVHVAAERPDAQIITLGGYDERPLWEAWRDCNQHNISAGHLYAPQLNEPDEVNREHAVHMARTGTNLTWTSKEDIRNTLDDARNRTGWSQPGRFIPWSFLGCIQLPRFLRGEDLAMDIGGASILSVDSLEASDGDAVVAAFTDVIAAEYF